MKIFSKIDYLTLTRKYTENPLGGKVLTFFGAESLASDIVLDLTGQSGMMIASKAQRFYAFTFECGLTGCLVSISDDLFTQGVRVVFSGQSLQRHNDPNFLLERAICAGWQVTRIDLALDILDAGFSVDDYIEMYQLINGDNKKRTWSKMHSPSGSTLYIGSRQSARMLRVYDKGKEQKTDKDWIRFEMEYKDYASNPASTQYLLDAGFLYREVLDMLRIDGYEGVWHILERVEGYEHKPIKAPKTESQRVLWFKNQVMKAFEKIVDDDPLEALECLATVEETLLNAYAKWMGTKEEVPLPENRDKL